MLARFPIILLSLGAACSAAKTGERSAARVGSTAQENQRSQWLYQTSAAEDALLQETVSVLRARVQGIPGEVRVQAEAGKIAVSFADLALREQAALHELITRPGTLAVKKIESGAPFMEELCERVRADSKAGVMNIETALDIWQDSDGQLHQDCYLSANDRGAMLSPEEARLEGCAVQDPAARTHCIITGRRILERYLAEREDAAPGDGFEIVYEAAVSSTITGNEGERFWRTYYQQSVTEIDERRIRDVRVEMAMEKDPALVFELDEKGKEALATLTGGEQLGRKLSLMIDGQVHSAPVIHSEILGGTLMLLLEPGSRDQQAMPQELARVLKSGPLPTPLTRVDGP